MAGKEQSPIDIVRTAAESAAVNASLAIAFRPAGSGTLSIVNNGHAVQVQGDGLKGDSTRLGGVSYALQQFHFHRHSETTIDGEHLPLEAQFVHKAADGSILVVAVLYRALHALTPATSAVNQLPWKGLLPNARKVPLGGLNPAALLPERLGYFFYRGSLTTPPCTEGVKWVVLSSFQFVTPEQLGSFPFKANSRPVQPLHGRLVLIDGVKSRQTLNHKCIAF